MKVASYNIRKCVGLDRRRDPGRIIDVLNATGADIILLQEADRRLGSRPAALPRDLLETHSDFRALCVDPTGNSLGWHGNAALLRKGLHAKNLRKIDLPGTEPRGAISFRVGPIEITGTHFGLRRSDRRKQARELAELARGSDAPISFILGDLNEWSQKRGLEALDQELEIVSPGHSYHAARPIAALDRIATSAPAMLVDCGVTETKLAKRASDHLPIWAKFEIPKEELRRVDAKSDDQA